MILEVTPYEFGLITSCLTFWLENPQVDDETDEEDRVDISQENSDIQVLLDRLNKEG